MLPILTKMIWEQVFEMRHPTGTNTRQLLIRNHCNDSYLSMLPKPWSASCIQYPFFATIRKFKTVNAIDLRKRWIKPNQTKIIFANGMLHPRISCWECETRAFDRFMQMKTELLNMYKNIKLRLLNAPSFLCYGLRHTL